MSNYDIAKELHTKVFNLFDYRFDSHQYMVEEHWTSHADAVERGDRFKDDCDGFACTMAELLLRRGVSALDVKLIYCITETGEAHLVCGVDGESTTWIAENRYNYVYDWEKREGYKWMYFMRLDDKGVWRKVF